jgi:cytoskeleton protein RodZ
MDQPEAPPPPAPPAKPPSIGERLRAGRERAGLSVVVAAEKLHLDPKVVEALEADRFAELGAAVYVRGHLRRYADFVGEPGAELVSRYTERETLPKPPDLTVAPKSEAGTDSRRLVTPLVGLVCAAVLLLAIWWIVAGSHTKAVTSTPSTNAAMPAATLDTSSTSNSAAGETGAAATATPPPSPTGAVPAGASARPVASETAAAPKREAGMDASAAQAPEAQLKLGLASDSWVEIYDARGERLFYDVASAGSVQSVSGRAPLRVVLGNAAGVTVEVDGRAREIPAGAIEGEGARFVVNRSGSLSRAR